MTWIVWTFFLFASVRLIVSFVNWITRPYWPRRRTRYVARPEVSVLIPVRNEERNIGCLLEDLSRDGTGIREILIYDDRSTDSTADIVRRCARENDRVRLISGEELPDEWLGKCHACYRLAQEAAGAYLLFLDADVRIREQAVVRALRYVQRTGVRLLSVFPHQLMPDRGTRLAVPLMNWILLSLLPLAAVRRSPHASLCAANGQFMFFEAETYRALQPHRKFRSAPVEDMEIAGDYKKNGHSVAVLLARYDIECTMYRSLDEAVEGFSKNIFRFFGGSRLLCYLFAAATTAAPLLIFFCSGVIPGLLYLSIVVMIRVFVSAASRQSAGGNILRMIPQQAVLWLIIAHASARKRKKELLWKGRNIYSRSSTE